MSEIINNTLLNKNITVNNKNNFLNINSFNCSYQTIFQGLKNTLLKKKMKFEHIFTKEKKYDDQNIIYPSITINSLINILNSQNKIINVHNIDKNNNNFKEKNKIDISKKSKSNIAVFLDDNKNFRIKNFQNKCVLLKKSISNDQLKDQDNQFFIHHISKKINNINFLQDVKKIDFLKKYNVKIIKNNQGILFYSGSKNDKCNFFYIKNINKIHSIYNKKNFFKNIYKHNNYTFNNHASLHENIKSVDLWKQSISKKILLSISNANNEASIKLNQIGLGSIYIQINMKGDNAVLNLLSNHNKIRIMLDSYLPVLRDALMKKKIFLKKVHIHNCSYVKNKIFISLFQRKKNNINQDKYKPINLYV